MRMKGLSIVLVLFFVSYPLTQSECENACSGHGRCTIFDMCVCSRNWQGSDCGDSKFRCQIDAL
ncbi:hypothetical protein EON65_14960 [archaeon]|nr:MAG: hypothetical protein EON65_14960 [archaeon]